MRILAGDIGGTSSRLRWVENQADGSLVILAEKSYPSSQYPDLVPIVKQFIKESEQSLPPQRACFAIAGPVQEQTAQLTNLPWKLTSSRLKEELDLERVELINDFTAIGYGILALPPDDLEEIQAGEVKKGAPIAVLGAGTGLGEGFLIWHQDHYQVYASEGGHADFAPRNEMEVQILTYLKQRHHRVSVERVVSGMGIPAIYQALKNYQVEPISTTLSQRIDAWEKGDQTIDAAAEIAQAALNQEDTLAIQTLDTFFSLYGAEAGNLALKLLPYGGLYVAGGIAPKNLSWLRKGNFIHAFLDKGRLSTVLQMIPIYVVLNPQVGLMGAASYAASW
jgi:glucokinase